MAGGESVRLAPEFAILDHTPADGGEWENGDPKDNPDHHGHSYIVSRTEGGFTAEVDITPVSLEVGTDTYSRIRLMTLGRLPVAMERLTTPPLLVEEDRQRVAVVMAAEAFRFANLDITTQQA